MIAAYVQKVRRNNLASSSMNIMLDCLGDISLLQCQKGVRTMGMPIHLHPFDTEQDELECSKLIVLDIGT